MFSHREIVHIVIISLEHSSYHGRLGTINWADRLAILTLDACHVQTGVGRTRAAARCSSSWPTAHRPDSPPKASTARLRSAPARAGGASRIRTRTRRRNRQRGGIRVQGLSRAPLESGTCAHPSLAWPDGKPPPASHQAGRSEASPGSAPAGFPRQPCCDS